MAEVILRFVLKAELPPECPYNSRGTVSKYSTNDGRGDDVATAEVNGDIAPADDMVVEEVAGEDATTYVLDTHAVVILGEDAGTSSRRRTSSLSRLGHDLDLNGEAASESALSQGRPPPQGTGNAHVVPPGDVLFYFRINDAWMVAFDHLFPERCGGPLDPTR